MTGLKIAIIFFAIAMISATANAGEKKKLKNNLKVLRNVIFSSTPRDGLYNSFSFLNTSRLGRM